MWAFALFLRGKRWVRECMQRLSPQCESLRELSDDSWLPRRNCSGHRCKVSLQCECASDYEQWGCWWILREAAFLSGFAGLGMSCGPPLSSPTCWERPAYTVNKRHTLYTHYTSYTHLLTPLHAYSECPEREVKLSLSLM